MPPSLFCLKINSRKSARRPNKHACDYITDVLRTVHVQKSHTIHAHMTVLWQCTSQCCETSVSASLVLSEAWVIIATVAS